MLAHLCRCTGWQTVVEAVRRRRATGRRSRRRARCAPRRGRGAPGRGPHIALGGGGFADDTAPTEALVALRGADGEWVVGETLAEARHLSGKVQGRRTTAPLTWPLEVPEGEWIRTLRTTWVEPAYLEPDASWCLPGGEPASAHGNGGAFGGKLTAEVEVVARRLADEHGRPVRVIDPRRRGAARTQAPTDRRRMLPTVRD